jgi:bifunctional DNA-binding transcriptional regulator/antitoxin component of YhaV-PrlF toxin-antitoxin module
MDTSLNVPIESGNRIELPEEWLKTLGLNEAVRLEVTKDGILIRPCRRSTWDEVFSTRLSVVRRDPGTAPEITQVSGDDLVL